MKNIDLKSQIVLLLLTVFSLGITSCKDSGPQLKKIHIQQATLTKIASVRAMSVGSSAPVSINVPGKIYIYGDYLFINEAGRGIHIVDNKNPAAPRIINFIQVPGNVDMAVNSNYLYADSYVDLLTFDISNPLNITLKNRTKDAFAGYYIDLAKETLVTYKDTVISVSEDYRRGGSVDEMLFLDAASSGSKSYGQGGSSARFTLMNDHLYTVDHSSLGVFDVSNASLPKFIVNEPLGWGIETIFPYENKLFIGTNTGMQIYNAINPASPEFLSSFGHVKSCDPVVVAGKYAYVTLRTGNFCAGNINELDVLNIEDILNPKLVKTYPMQNPHGLAVSGNHLYLGEGEFGLKTFLITDPLKIGERKVQQIPGFDAADIIPGPKSLIVTGEDGVYQFNYSNPSNIKQISKIKIQPIYN